MALFDLSTNILIIMNCAELGVTDFS
jgi:hypothetical protein